MYFYDLPKRTMTTIVAICCIVMVVSCDYEPSSKDKVVPVIDRTDVSMLIEVKLFDTRRKMRDAYEKYYDVAIHNYRPDEVLGKAVWTERRSVKTGELIEYSGIIPICTIWSVKPMKIDDERTRTLGHELLHCVYGRYHKEQ